MKKEIFEKNLKDAVKRNGLDPDDKVAEFLKDILGKSPEEIKEMNEKIKRNKKIGGMISGIISNSTHKLIIDIMKSEIDLCTIETKTGEKKTVFINRNDRNDICPVEKMADFVGKSISTVFESILNMYIEEATKEGK